MPQNRDCQAVWESKIGTAVNSAICQRTGHQFFPMPQKQNCQAIQNIFLSNYHKSHEQHNPSGKSDYIVAIASFPPQSLLLIVNSLCLSFPVYFALPTGGKEASGMAGTRNLCAPIPIALHEKVCEERDKAGLTNGQYITALLTEYYD